MVLFGGLTPLKLIRCIRPHVLVKGGDWALDEIVGKDYVDRVFRVQLKAGYSSTAIIQKIIASYNDKKKQGQHTER